MDIRKVSETATKMTLAWDPVPGADAGYRGREVGADKWTQTQATQMVFRKGAAVEIEAMGILDRGQYPPPAPPPPASKPSVPSGLSAAVVNETQVRLAWDPNPSSEGVDVYQTYMDDGNLDLAVTGTTYTTSSLVAGSTHTFRVSAHNAQGYGDWTAAVSVTIPGTVPETPADDYTYRFATFNPSTDKITGCLNRFQPSYSWWVPGSPEGTPWPDGGGIHPVSHPTYGPGFNLVVTDDMLYGNVAAGTGPKDSNLVRFASETGLVDERLRVPATGSKHTWKTTIMRPSGFTWRNEQYESVWEVPMTAAGSNNVGHHIYLQKDYHWPGFSYYFGHQWGSGPLGGVYWTRHNCPIPFNADEYHSLRWEILWSDVGQANGAIKCWTSVNGGPEQQWLNLTNVVTKPPQFSQIYQMYVNIRTDLGNPTHSLHVHNMQVKIA